MRNRPNVIKNSEQKFIEAAHAEVLEKHVQVIDLHDFVKKEKWPFENYASNPCLAQGSMLKKPLLLCLNEQEWNSVDRHTKSLNVSKQEWIKHAIYKLLEYEQFYFVKK